MSRDFRGPSKGATESVALSDAERKLVEAYAAERGLSFDEAAEQLCSDGLAARVRKKTGRSPSASVRRFHRH